MLIVSMTKDHLQMAYRPASASVSPLWLIVHNDIEILEPVLGSRENNQAKMCGRRVGFMLVCHGFSWSVEVSTDSHHAV